MANKNPKAMNKFCLYRGAETKSEPNPDPTYIYTKNKQKKKHKMKIKLTGVNSYSPYQQIQFQSN